MAASDRDRDGLTRPPTRGRAWTSFVAGEDADGRTLRSLHEAGAPSHRLRVEHDAHTLLIHLSHENGAGWTTIAVDRATRQVAVVADRRQSDSAREAFEQLYDSFSTMPPAGAVPDGHRVQAHHPEEPAAGRPLDD
ncbi:MAG: hypothetical protein JOZ07_04680 [Solirubrobacterales bacterium]|nr:hypothetical protein [Solirubrobacterales bacterium]